TAPLDQLEPYLVTDNNGGAIIAWRDGRVSAADQNVYAQRVNAGGAAQWTSDGVVVCGASGQQDNTHIAADGAGGAVISWLDQRAAAFEVYAQRVGPTGIPQWTADGIPVGTSTSGNVPRICSSSTGGAIVAWSEFHASYELYAQQLDLGGNKLWGASGAV